MRNLFKIISLSCLFSFDYSGYYASSKYKDSIFSICHLILKEPPLTKLNPNKTNVKSYIEKYLKRRSWGFLYNEEYNVVRTSLATAFYLGDGRFATNFHFAAGADPSKGDGYAVIKYKDKIIHLDKGIQHDSISDLLVLHSTSPHLKDLVPLEIGFSKKDLDGGEIAAFDYDYNESVALKMPLDSTEYFNLGTLKMKLKMGMDGSPLLSQNKVIGIVHSYDSKFINFTSSLHLFTLLRSAKINCNLNKCINDGLEHLINETNNGNNYAGEALLPLLQREYVEEKYSKSEWKNKRFYIFKYYWKNKILYIFKYTWRMFKKFPKDFL